MTIPLSLYIHFPWCTRKCPYCDFNSHETGGEIPEQAYVDTLLADFSNELKGVQGRQISSIFMGGGTPSLFTAEAIDRLLKQLSMQVQFAEDIEITMEANPGSAEYLRFAGYRAAGVNRLSLGVQSFGQQQLNLLGRIHSSNEAVDAFKAARDAGFDNINLDLMHGLPEQSESLALFDLQHAIDLQPEHISWYQLTIEPNTIFYSKPPALPDEDALWQIYQEGLVLLTREGYQRYEISAFAKPGKQARHNLNYWQFGDYIGIGAGAHGKVTYPADAVSSDITCLRHAKTRLPKDYLQVPKSREKTVAKDELLLEFLLNNLRLNSGFEKALLTERTGLPTSALTAFINRAVGKGLLETIENRVRPTDVGLQYLNELLMLVDD